MIAECIHTSSLSTVKVERRGRILPGYQADLCLFDPEQFQDTATFTHPNALSTGMELVFINGRKVFAENRVISIEKSLTGVKGKQA
ncbi:hypothetical protein ACFLQR_04165 [Verrucomicrobiota bacterium]